ncbi:hypothetical protein GYMLUDRAFT_48134 [Collybiopsis luxurians FD-317 M1]|uniref:MYND-type domain-containing protein n=1 Tax=Collybiopsis luxurians FD-317 M1 TaxID=944289 RepID=A0A0D0CJH7_9AGAR|nr:hypothetical protein GYMLUDRAFT_48134 [Collybiopsis luxurians FD-317 M1]
MAHPLVFPLRTYFYPVGNTTPLNLIQDIAPEQSANILLLGCGDPRNIFFTLHCNAFGERTSFPRKLDITCCDIEPAVLARNILLFTLIIDDESSKDRCLWNIFYDIYIDAEVMHVLIQQCQKLVDLAADVSSWHASPYGLLLRACTQHTIFELRRYWSLYERFENLPAGQKIRISRAFSEALNKSEKSAGSSRSAGLFQMFATKCISEHFIRFWSSGVNHYDKNATAQAKLINPTFVYSIAGEGFAVHYGTDAFSSFHLAPAFSDSCGSIESRRDISKERAYAFVRSTFQTWCSTFREVASKDMLRIRFFAGDALALCSLLHCRASFPSTPSTFYATRWKATVLELDSGDYDNSSAYAAPLAFDVIDTSNLVDHLGLLNILAVVSPLLSRTPHSSLYTETLLATGSDPRLGFLELMCGDLTMLSLLFDLVPSSFVSGFNSHSNIHELTAHSLTEYSPQFHERLCWKIISFSEPAIIASMYFEPKQLGEFLFNVYLGMFSDENLSLMRMQSSNKDEAFKQKVLRGNLIHYTRATFAAFLKRVKERVTTDWDLVMDVLLEFIISDRTLLVGSNYFQDLCCQLHLFGVFTIETLRPNYSVLARTRIPGWGNIPPIIFVSLVVPRRKLKVLENLPLEKLGSPLLQFDVYVPGFQTVFFCIQTAFGALSNSSGHNEEPTLVLAEDPDSWAGSADLVVSVAVPAWIFSHKGVEVGLNVRSTTSSFHLTSILGFDLHIFRTPVTDKTHVFFTRSRPNAQNKPQGVCILPSRPCIESKTNHTIVRLDASCQCVAEMSTKAFITDPAEQAVLDGPSRVPVVPQQTSACRVTLRFGSVEHFVQFPFPINGNRTRLKIARKSHYIEVIAFPSGHNSPFFSGINVNKFPVLLHGSSPVVWNLHRLYLNRLPVVDLDKDNSLWLKGHLSFAASEYERGVISGGEDPRRSKPLTDVKETLQGMFVQFTEIQGGPRISVFVLKDPVEGGGIYAALFLSSLRLDLSSHSIVLDGYVLPITKTLPKDVLQDLANLGMSVSQVMAVGQEMRAWKQLIPALVERCRQTWMHQDDCEYIKTGRVPLSYAIGENVICHCGQGRDVEGMLRKKEWKRFAPFSTRIAISPLYAVSYMDSVVGNLFRKNDRKAGAEEASKKLGELSLSESHGEGCRKCGSNGQLLACGRCKKVKYCSKKCQQDDWKTHKRLCHQS